MVLRGHIKKEIERKVRNCVIEDGLSPDKCVEQIEERYELDGADRKEILALAKSIGKMK